MKKLTKEQIIMLHSELIRETGGSDGLRDEGLLDSALNAPFQGFGDVDNFPSLQQKGARLGYGLICNHAFIDGNKRIGAHIMLLAARVGLSVEHHHCLSVKPPNLILHLRRRCAGSGARLLMEVIAPHAVIAACVVDQGVIPHDCAVGRFYAADLVEDPILVGLLMFFLVLRA